MKIYIYFILLLASGKLLYSEDLYIIASYKGYILSADSITFMDGTRFDYDNIEVEILAPDKFRGKKLIFVYEKGIRRDIDWGKTDSILTFKIECDLINNYFDLKNKISIFDLNEFTIYYKHDPLDNIKKTTPEDK